MPQTKSAKRAMRQATNRAIINQRIRKSYKQAIKLARLGQGNLSQVFGALDTASKKGLIHRRKAARLKSRMARLLTAIAPPHKKRPKAAKT